MRPGPRVRLVPLLLCLASVPALGAAPGDDWLGPDKSKHFAVSLGLAGAGYGAGAALFEAPRARWLTGAGLALGAGLGKEFYDLGRGSHFSFRDLAWDVAGTAVGLGLAWGIESLLTGDEPEPPRATASAASWELAILGVRVARW